MKLNIYLIYLGLFLMSCHFMYSPKVKELNYFKEAEINDSLLNMSEELVAEDYFDMDSLSIVGCIYKNLSDKYDYKVKLLSIESQEKDTRNRLIKIEVYEKLTYNLIDSFSNTPGYLFPGVFSNCEKCRSYRTNFNLETEILDGDFGDIIIADFNFDSREDIAVIHESGMSSGSTYNYYIQTLESKFTLDSFLSESMQFFPSIINSKNKTLTTYVMGGACHLGEHVYKYNIKKLRWKEISHKVRNICD
ncbi:MAG: hypothetical protein IPI90_03260 [Saprospiraceae bacterium]|nr:hypothetical protein [Candidatus Vicinibacter affinis]